MTLDDHLVRRFGRIFVKTNLWGTESFIPWDRLLVVRGFGSGWLQGELAGTRGILSQTRGSASSWYHLGPVDRGWEAAGRGTMLKRRGKDLWIRGRKR